MCFYEKSNGGERSTQTGRIGLSLNPFAPDFQKPGAKSPISGAKRPDILHQKGDYSPRGQSSIQIFAAPKQQTLYYFDVFFVTNTYCIECTITTRVFEVIKFPSTVETKTSSLQSKQPVFLCWLTCIISFPLSASSQE